MIEKKPFRHLSFEWLSAAQLIYLALNATSQEWKHSVREWHALRRQFAIMFEDCFPMA